MMSSSSSSSSSGGRGKLTLKGEKVQNLSFQRQTPKFLQQYQHLLGGSRKNYTNEELIDEGRELVRPGEKLTLDAIKASGAQIANEDENGDDEDIRKIKALYQRDDSQSILSKPNAKPMTAADAFGIEGDDDKEEERAFDPNTQKITFKRKSKDITGHGSGRDKDGDDNTSKKIATIGESNNSNKDNDKYTSNNKALESQEKKEKKKRPIVSFEYED